MFQRKLIWNRDEFTASTALENFSPGRYIDKINIHIKGEMTAAASVSAPAFAAIIDPLEVRLLGSPVVFIRGTDLWALNILYLKKNPLTIVAGAATDQHTKIMGLECPIWQPPRAIGELTIKVNRTAVSGVDTETLTVAELSSDATLEPTYFHAVEIPATTASVTGWGNFTDFPQPGDLHGVLLYSTTIPTATSEVATIQELMLVIDGMRAFHANWHELKGDAPSHATFADPADATFIDNYAYIDLSKDPVPAASSVRLDVNAGVANEAYRVIPIYRVAP